MVRVLLVDDHPILREGLAMILSRTGKVSIVGEASDGHAALALVGKLRPDVVIMDVGMPNLNGIEATRQIISEYAGVRVIGLSALADRRYVNGMLEAGALAYVVKSSAGDELLQAIHAVMRNRRFISAEIARSDTSLGSSGGTLGATPLLSQREREVLQRLAEGQTSTRIGTELCISIRTVETHRRNLMRKLRLHNLADLTRYAIREGLIQPE